jgi:hypothetical protein
MDVGPFSIANAQRSEPESARRNVRVRIFFNIIVLEVSNELRYNPPTLFGSIASLSRTWPGFRSGLYFTVLLSSEIRLDCTLSSLSMTSAVRYSAIRATE